MEEREVVDLATVVLDVGYFTLMEVMALNRRKHKP